jgi:DNA-binding IclR family transcriptional regulator
MVTPVKSAVRVLEVLELFQHERKPLTLKEICASLEYPQSSGTVLMKNLVTHGYLSYDRAARMYFPTLKVASLGDWVGNALFGQSAVFEVMRDLHNATGEAVAIAAANDIYIQYIRMIQSIHPLRFHVEEGSMRPLTLSATGWLLMSVHNDRAVEKLIRRANIATRRVEDRQPLPLMMERVREARRTGVAYAENLPFQGGATICAMLPLTVQGRAVVLGMGGALERIRPNRERYLQLVKDLAASLKPAPEAA